MDKTVCVWCCRDLLKPSDEGGLSKPWPSLTCGCRKRIGSEENWKRLVRRLGHDEAVKPGYQYWIRYFQKVMDFFAEIHGQKQEDRGVVNHDFLLKARP